MDGADLKARVGLGIVQTAASDETKFMCSGMWEEGWGGG